MDLGRALGGPVMLGLAVLLATGGVAQAKNTDFTILVPLKPGVAKVMPGQLSGYRMVRYQFSVADGEKLTAKLASKNRFLYFNLVPKGSSYAVETEPVPREVTEWSGPLKAGTYDVAVFLMRAEARRGRVAHFQLSLKRG